MLKEYELNGWWQHKTGCRFRAIRRSIKNTPTGEPGYEWIVIDMLKQETHRFIYRGYRNPDDQFQEIKNSLIGRDFQ